ncbi:unnamed protein product [Oreochromis niloticus]|nr:unnamed protein product [Mustela putorius furo]
MILLLSFWIVTGLMAEDPTATYYRLKNSSVCLNVRKPPPYKRGEWKFNMIFITDDTEINPIYKDRVVYSAGNLSLCINNLADTDAGIYEVSYRQNFTSVTEKHEVIVQDVVPTPVIIMSKLGSNQSAGLCSITVNCSIQDYWLWSVCDEDGCRRSQKSFSEVNITIFTENRAVVCRGNNHVSTNQASENLTLCLMAEDPTATYYRLKNSSVCLNVRKPPPYKRGEWKFNTIIITDDTEINPIYTDRVVYSAGNLSLCINNLADTDAGIYEVSYIQNFITMSEKHEVIVQDVVPTPVIIMSKLGSNQSAGLCSITVNCSIQDYWLWSVCDEDGCRRSQKSFSEVNITIFTENRAVVCRGNNHVSTNQASENLTLCLMAEDPTATYYRLKNSSVCLNVRKPPPYKRGEWKFNTIIITDDTEINPIYTDRVVYSAGNLSLCINNLADTDAGIYEVSYIQNFTSVTEKHEVIVQDVVPTPVIIMSKLGSNQSAGLCSITVNCSIQDYWLWSVCDEDGCRRSQKSFSEVNITIFTENRAVVCRGNNHVSTNQASENLTLCNY